MKIDRLSEFEALPVTRTPDVETAGTVVNAISNTVAGAGGIGEAELAAFIAKIVAGDSEPGG